MLKSNVSGGHYVDDLRLHIPSEKEISLGYWKAKRSAELQEAIEKGLVSVEKVLRDSKKKIENRSLPEKQDGVDNDDYAEEESSNPKKEEGGSGPKEIQQLKIMNKQLLLTVQELMEQQKELSQRQEDLIQKMDEYMDQPLPSIDLENIPTKPEKGDHVSGSFEPFVPEKIRTGKAKASGDLEMEEEGNKSSSSVDEAAEIMKKLEEEGS